MSEYFHKARIFTENYYFYALEHVIQDSTFVSPCGCQFDFQRKGSYSLKVSGDRASAIGFLIRP
jgi:hypothetical protein